MEKATPPKVTTTISWRRGSVGGRESARTSPSSPRSPPHQRTRCSRIEIRKMHKFGPSCEVGSETEEISTPLEMTAGYDIQLACRHSGLSLSNSGSEMPSVSTPTESGPRRSGLCSKVSNFELPLSINGNGIIPLFRALREPVIETPSGSLAIRRGAFFEVLTTVTVSNILSPLGL